MRLLNLKRMGRYAEAIVNLDKEIACLETLKITTKDQRGMVMFNSTLRDRKLWKRILEMKIKEDELSSRMYKMEKKMKEFEEKNDPRKFT